MLSLVHELILLLGLALKPCPGLLHDDHVKQRSLIDTIQLSSILRLNIHEYDLGVPIPVLAQI